MDRDWSRFASFRAGPARVLNSFRPGYRVARATLAATLLVAAVAATSASARNGSIALAALNKERKANGLPTLAANSQGEAGCAAHNAYQQKNRQTVSGEDPSRADYSTLGDISKQPFEQLLSWYPPNLERGMSGLQFPDWLKWNENPWNDSLSLFEMLDPAATSAGADEIPGFTCLRISTQQRTTLDRFYSYPGSNTAGGAPYSTDPSQEAVLVWGNCAPSSAALAGSNGSIATKLQSYGNGGIITPVHQLPALLKYTVNVSWTCGTQTFTFSEGALENDLRVAADVDPDTRLVTLEVIDQANTPATMTLTNPSGRSVKVPLHNPHNASGADLASRPMKLMSGRYKVCAANGGVGTNYAAARACKTFTVRAR